MRELGQCILWKNIAQSENYAEIQGLFANVRKIFWRRGKKISQANKIAALLPTCPSKTVA
jgi:hypothetical protein